MVNNIERSQIKFIQKTNIEFIDYDISDYHDQDKIKKAISSYLGYSCEFLDEETYKEFATRFHVMELVITLEDYKYD